METIESDLPEAQMLRTSPYSQKLARLSGKDKASPIRRVFLTGANHFILTAGRLLRITSLVKQYFPSTESIGCFARITDMANKTDKELKMLHEADYDRLTIGVETGG